ncbi:MAG: DUF177 domain-containing protein [Hormoscilla sp. GUM202]|nr:DUF177 domain-containing protein [Hormoscilla sp. GUM202]
MEPIYIPNLVKAPDRTLSLDVRDRLPGLESLTAVTGRMQVRHQRNYLEVSATAETIITLTCDRCLQQYNHRLKVDTSELIWLDAAADKQDADGPVDRAADGPKNREVGLEDLVEVLHPRGYFYPDGWLYEHLCLSMPHRQLCDRQCPGIQPGPDARESQPLLDRRWASLAGLKIEN